MKKSIAFAGAFIGSLVIASGSFADGGFAEHMSQCVDKFASASDSASVTLECTAGSGKLSDCKVVENTAPAKGFDKAALCVAAFLPIGEKTGTIRVPLRFDGA
jgi:hypothetical protein